MTSARNSSTDAAVGRACRFRQPNGQTVRVDRWGSSKTAATNNLQDELRNRAGERTMMLSAGSRSADAADIYLVKIADRYEDPPTTPTGTGWTTSCCRRWASY